MTCALLSTSNRPVLSSPKKGRGLLEAEDRIIDNHPRHAFCNRQLCYSAAELQQCGQPETADLQCYTSGSNSYSPNNHSPIQQSSPWSSALSSHQPQCSTALSSSSTNSPLHFLQPLTPSSTNGSEPSGSPYLTPHPLPYADSPQSPLYWCVTSYVPEECNWREYLDEIIDDVRAEIQSETDFNSQFNRSTNFDASASRKRKISSSTVSFAASPSSSDSETADVLLTSSNGKRAKKYSLNALSLEQIALRKKEQNRIAAQRYRSRRNQTLEEGRHEIAFLEKRNDDLQREAAALEEEIRDLKSMLVGDLDSTITN
ncbi:hypothetical protein M3Y94_00193600 [Aphelenchoides besseyi]|nr:hypothetical protein M3Y94_00193600 [Aphelenchoides besseyi]